LDGCRFRAPRSFLTAIRDVAEQAPPEIRFCDVAEQLQSRSDLAAPGNDYFLEHVHFNFEGHWEVACILGRSIVEDVLEKDWRPERLPDDAARDELLGVTLLDHLAAESITLVGLGAWPFTLSPARREETLALKSRMEERFYTLEPMEREIFAGLPLDAMQQHLHLAMGDAWLAAGKLDRALAAYNRHLERRPWDGSGYTSAATALEKQGETAEAGVIRARAKKARDGG
jgi:tetratricopeptide (TPR) repeat protein